ncbi:MAG TPA: hypothetical protein VJ437_06210 [Acidiferrobacterales bacterium]|nr:hypothetical protein [Acidiferrobacterales bacterium]
MSQVAREKAARTGELPHEFLLQVMRGHKITGHKPTFSERMDAAKAAAPYYAPRLAAVAANVNQTNDPVRDLLAAIDGSSAKLTIKRKPVG